MRLNSPLTCVELPPKRIKRPSLLERAQNVLDALSGVPKEHLGVVPEELGGSARQRTRQPLVYGFRVAFSGIVFLSFGGWEDDLSS